jgi:hypothetical protein
MIRKLFLAISTRSPLPPSNQRDDYSQALAVRGSGICNFVAMEYFLGILNRTYLVSSFENGIGGARVFGVLGNPGYMSPETAANPQTYINQALLKQYENLSFDSSNFLAIDSANFFYPKQDVVSISIDMTPKWGMGNVRYSGRIVIGLRDGKKRGFILLGSQDVHHVVDVLKGLL